MQGEALPTQPPRCLSDGDELVNVDLVALAEPLALAATFRGTLTQETMGCALRTTRDALRACKSDWIILRTHDVESMDAEAADELARWLCDLADEGALTGVGYCPHSDDGSPTRDDVYRAMHAVRSEFPLDWYQAPRVETVLLSITVSQYYDPGDLAD